MSRKTKKTKTRNKFYLLCIRDKAGMVLEIVPHSSYDTLMLEGQDRSKALKGSYEIFDAYGRLIDGNFPR
jgi:hypothetical protein